MKGSVAKGIAPVLCPACPVDSDSEGLATVEDGEPATRMYPGSPPYLADFQCEHGHTLADLNQIQEAAVLESALDWLQDAAEGMQSAYDDARFDSYRDGEMN